MIFFFKIIILFQSTFVLCSSLSHTLVSLIVSFRLEQPLTVTMLRLAITCKPTPSPHYSSHHHLQGRKKRSMPLIVREEGEVVATHPLSSIASPSRTIDYGQ